MAMFSASRLVRCGLPLALALPLAGPTSADFLLWSAASGDWDTDANWVQLLGPNHEPDATDTASISGSVDVTQAGEVAELVRLFGSGEMNILGGDLTTTHGEIAYLDTADNTVTVSGSGSTWGVGSNLTIGNVGTGTLNIGTDGQVTVGGTTLIGAQGTLNLDGGTFNTNGGLMLNGGTLNRTSGSFNFNLGAGQTLSANSSAQIGFTGFHNINNGTTISLSGGADFTLAEYLDVGRGSDGTLSVSGSGTTLTTNTVVTTFLDWGLDGGTGSVTLSDQAQAMINADEIRFAGNTVAGTQGSLTIQSGATMTANDIALASAGDGAGTGTISIDGAGSSLTLNGDATLTVGHADTGTATLNLTNGGTLNTGTGLTTFNATATLDETDGSLSVNGDLLIDGADVTIDGDFTLADSDTAFTARNNAQVAFDRLWSIDGGSIYRVESGADLFMNDFFLIGAVVNPGFSDFGDGTLIIDGAGSSLSIGNQFVQDPIYIGDAPGVSGTLTIQNNATANIGSDRVFLTSSNTDTGSVGILNVLSGATSTTNRIDVATHTEGTGEINVDGAGSALTIRSGEALIVGANSSIKLIDTSGSTASLNITAGGVVTAGHTEVSTGGSSIATVNIDGMGSTLNLRAGEQLLLGTSGLAYGLSEANLNINNGGVLDAHVAQVEVRNNGELNLAGGALFAQTITRDTGGAFNFTGGNLGVVTFNGDLTNQGGTLRPGDTLAVDPTFNQIGTTTVIGDYTQQPGGTLAIELTSVFRGGVSGASDLLDVAGDLTLAGTLEITLGSGFPLLPGVRADILDWGTIGGAFDAVVLIDTFDDLGNADLGLNLAGLYTTGELSLELLGDANADGFVGVEDLDLLLANWGDSVNLYDYAAGDLTGDGLVGAADLAVVQANWGNGTPGGNVPEPGSAALLGLMMLGLGRRRTR